MSEQEKEHGGADPIVEESNSDKDIDIFEDANGSTRVNGGHAGSPTNSTRSLTNPKLRPSSTEDNDNQQSVDVLPTPVIESQDTSQPKSPLLTSHRLSAASLDNVNLEEDVDLPTVAALKDLGKKPSMPVKAPLTATLMGLSGALPSVPWSPPPQAPTSVPKAQGPVSSGRKLTSPFSWLSRNTSAGKEPVTSPPLPPRDSSIDRRNTASSLATINSNPEMMLSKLEEGIEFDSFGGVRGPGRNSLRDRFKLLRMREEAGMHSLDVDPSAGIITGLVGRSASLGLGIASPASVEEYSPTSATSTNQDPLFGSHVSASDLATNISDTAPSKETAASVDWDLWQTVVYEGPAAVARTSAEELNKAIANGIPSAIRGVVWQVLAQSKNEELESVYKDLVARGTDSEKESMSASSGAARYSTVTSNGSVSVNSKDKEAIVSSASSVHSDNSNFTPVATNGTRASSPLHEKDPDIIARAQAAALVERKKKAKEDTAYLQKLEKAIKRDLGARTSFSKFAASAGLQEGLFGVCKSYALFDEGVGYAQGMNFLAMPLLFNMPEEEAFCLLVRLMNQYHLRDLFIQDMPGLHMHLYQFDRLLEDFEPALYCHLHRRQVTPHLYATQWFLTLFAYRFPLQLVLRIYDLILSEGLEAILKFGIVLMQKNAVTLLNMTDMVSLTNFLKDRLFDVYIDQAPSASSILESGFFGSSGARIDKEVYRADMLIQDACAVKVTPEMLKAYTVEWEEKTRLEAAREAELETLRATNLALNQKVYRLEKRVEDHDTEHAALATELVRTKVESEELKDESESLKVQVRELRLVIDTQPGEVEERLKTEMDRLMKRNQEVHEDNTKLEEEISEMEQTLVATKMQFAELNGRHEALTRKWTDLRKALD